MRNEVRVTERQEGGVRSRFVPIDPLLITAVTEGTAETLYTVNTPGFILRHLAVCCRNVADELTMHAVPAGGSIQNGNLQLIKYSVPVRDALNLTNVVGRFYEQGTTLQVYGANVGSLIVSGWGEELL